MMYMPSQERLKYHELMEEFVSLIPKGSIVYDIGKSFYHDYKDKFKGHRFKVIDMNEDKSPDIVLNIEGLNQHNVEDYIHRAAALLCNGVVEQCNDPLQMIRSCNAILKSDGVMLLGCCSVGYNLHALDRYRFTKQGAEHALKRCGFSIINTWTVERNGLESYVYVMARKTKEV